MNTSNTYETTDKTLFMEEIVDDSVTMTMDDIEKILIHHSKDNGNVPHTPESTMMTLAGILQKEYAMRRLFSKDVANAHRLGNIHIHNIRSDMKILRGIFVQYKNLTEFFTDKNGAGFEKFVIILADMPE